MLHWYVIGLCGLVVRILDGRSRCPGFESRQVKQDLVFKKDKATLHVIPKRCEDTINHSN